MFGCYPLPAPVNNALMNMCAQCSFLSEYMFSALSGEGHILGGKARFRASPFCSWGEGAKPSGTSVSGEGGARVRTGCPNNCPDVGIRPLLQFPHLPRASPVLLTLLFCPYFLHPIEFCVVLYILSWCSGTPACSQLVFCRCFCV